MMKLQPYEKELVGAWIVANNEVIGDSVCTRIEWLISHHLIQLAISKESGAWETLYKDPGDGRYWERTYPQGEMHGGGPPRLVVLTSDQATSKYQFR